VKQLKIIHKHGFTPEELNDYKAILHLNAIKAMKVLVLYCEKLKLELPKELQKAAVFFDNVNPLTTQLTPALVPKIKKLWECDSIQKCFAHSQKINLPDSAEYCFEHIERMAQPEYVPTIQDILQARQRTTGIIETVFELDRFTFTLIDVGGQRSERRKWIHCFQNVTALLYCVALDEYDMKLIEDDQVNRMEEALRVFEEMINRDFFEKTHVILFLNKDDLFKKKIKKVDINPFFKEYTGGNDYDAGVTFIKDLFTSKNHNPVAKTIYVHVTVAIDYENIKFVFSAIKDMIFSERMKQSGIL